MAALRFHCGNLHLGPLMTPFFSQEGCILCKNTDTVLLMQLQGLNKHQPKLRFLSTLKKKKKYICLLVNVGGLITVGISDLKRLLDWVRGSKSCNF